MFLMYIWLMLICCFKNMSTEYIPDEGCPPALRAGVKTFSNLEHLKSNRSEFGNFKNQIIEFEDNIQNIPTNAFVINSSLNVIQLYLDHKHIVNIEDRAFKSLVCLRTLNLNNNNIKFLKSDQFEDLKNLLKLDISWNNIQYLRRFTFKHMRKLQIIDASHNKIADVEDTAFYFLSKLGTLILSHNLLKNFYFYTFSHLIYLKYLDISYCSISSFSIGLLRESPFLAGVDLSVNELTHLKLSEVKIPFDDVHFLNVSHNYLMNLDVSNLKRLFPNRAFTVDINKNGFFCSELERVIINLKTHEIHISGGISSKAKQQRYSIICDTLNNTHDYSDEFDASKITTTTQAPRDSAFVILETYYNEVTRHKIVVILMAIFIIIAVLYDAFVIVDYIMDWNILKEMCNKGQNRTIDRPEEPNLYAPLRF